MLGIDSKELLPKSYDQFTSMPGNSGLSEAQASQSYKQFERNRVQKVNHVQRQLY